VVVVRTQVGLVAHRRPVGRTQVAVVHRTQAVRMQAVCMTARVGEERAIV
jgi:hypothetical protein